MTDKLVIQTLQTETLAAIAASDLPTLPVKMLGRTFTIPNDSKYLEVVLITNNPNDEFWGDEKIYQGIFRLVLHWQNDDKGVYDPMDVAQSVTDYFTKFKIFRTGGFGVKIVQDPKFDGFLEAGHEMLYTVSMTYRSFKP